MARAPTWWRATPGNTLLGRWAWPATYQALPKGEGWRCLRLLAGKATASWTACVAHVAVAPSGEVKVKKLTVATDVGTQVHPDNIRAQVEGAALWGLSLAMYEKGHPQGWRYRAGPTFDTYTPLRMSQTPEVAISVIANGEHATGVGETGGDRGRARGCERDLQRLRRPRPLAADYGRGGQGRHEGLKSRR